MRKFWIQIFKDSEMRSLIKIEFFFYYRSLDQ